MTSGVLSENEIQPKSWHRLQIGHGEDLKETLVNWARDNDVTLAWIQGIGELQNAQTASGYKSDDPQGDKFVRPLSDNQHVMGMGTIIRDEDGERVHLHGPMGREHETATGCWAGSPKTFRGMDFLVTVLE